ncbi:MAG: LysR family transcriptional regulator [Paracoccus sp. (in: a-proteobacteria)]
MISRNLRHLRLFLAVSDLGSVTLAAGQLNITQPAVTQAIAKLEAAAGGDLFERTRQGFFPTSRGLILAGRTRRAFATLDPPLSELSPRLRLVTSNAQLTALIAVCETENFTLAARSLGLAQPTVHRAISQLEQEAGRALFQRTAFGLVASRAARDLAQAARLAFRELEQAEADLAEAEGREVGTIVIGALPMARSVLLPGALAAFRKLRPVQPVQVAEGRYDELLTGLRRGEIDLIVGALRDPQPIRDIVQTPLFQDSMAILARNDHPLAGAADLTPARLAQQQWVVPRQGTPARAQFDALFADAGVAPPVSIIEAGSILLMREMLTRGDFLGCISELQAGAEIRHGLIRRLDVPADWTLRPIGVTTRENWQPTAAQSLMLDLLRDEAALAREDTRHKGIATSPDDLPL